MSEDTAGSGTPPQSAEALTAEIERTRLELGETVEALVAKTDVKARARHRAAEVADSLRGKARSGGTLTYGVAAAGAAALLLSWLTVRRRLR
jgi:hypothetical protein